MTKKHPKPSNQSINYSHPETNNSTQTAIYQTHVSSITPSQHSFWKRNRLPLNKPKKKLWNNGNKSCLWYLQNISCLLIHLQNIKIRPLSIHHNSQWIGLREYVHRRNLYFHGGNPPAHQPIIWYYTYDNIYIYNLIYIYIYYDICSTILSMILYIHQPIIIYTLVNWHRACQIGVGGLVKPLRIGDFQGLC